MQSYKVHYARGTDAAGPYTPGGDRTSPLQSLWKANEQKQAKLNEAIAYCSLSSASASTRIASIAMATNLTGGLEQVSHSYTWMFSLHQQPSELTLIRLVSVSIDPPLKATSSPSEEVRRHSLSLSGYIPLPPRAASLLRCCGSLTYSRCC